MQPGPEARAKLELGVSPQEASHLDQLVALSPTTETTPKSSAPFCSQKPQILNPHKL